MSQHIERLTGVLLNGKNYHLWARQVTFGLIGRDKFEHVTGEKSKPKAEDPTHPTVEERKEISEWRKSDNLVMSWLLATMEPHISDLMTYLDTARDMWVKAETMFGKKKNYSLIYQLQQLQQQNQSVTELFSKIQKKNDEIRVYRPLTADLDEIKRREEQDGIFTFLSKLDSSYEGVRSQILLMGELPSVDEVVGMVEREETRRIVMGTQLPDNPEAKAFITRSNPRPERRGDQTLTRCDYCKKEGHKREECWSLTRCDYCKKEGHKREECWCLNPHLRQKGRRGGGFVRGGDQRQNRVESREKMGYSAQKEKEDMSTNGAEKEIKGEVDMDQMRQLYTQLSVMFQGKSQKTSGMITNLTQNSLNSKWILDSGSTDHITGNKNLLNNYKKIETKQFVIVANGEKMEILGNGSISLLSRKISNVLHVNNCTSNLLSISKITRDLNCEITFTSKNVIFQELITKNIIGEGFLENGLYILSEEKCNFNIKKEEELGTLWHKRIGHPSDKILKCIFDFKQLDCSSCEICKLGKHTRLPFSLSNCKSKKPFEIIHSDVWGPAPIESFNGYKYFVIFIDDFSRTTWLHLLKNKSEVFSQFQEFYNFVENQYDAKIKTFRSDNGTEFVNQNFTNCFKQKGILHQTTCIYTPQQNGVSERKNRNLLEVTRVLLFQNNVPIIFWSDAVLTATYLINRLPSANLNFKSPLEILYQEKLNIYHLRVFGCTCYVHKNKQHKLDYTSIKAIFLGYSSKKRGINFMIRLTKNITFQEM